MNILYITIFPVAGLQQHDVYADIARELAYREHNIYTVSPLERRQKGKTILIKEDNALFLRVRTLNNQKVGAIEKMLALFSTPWLLRRGIMKHFTHVKFDLILYDTPFVRLANTIKRLKQKCNAKTYLLLKDIWPQTLVDLGSIKNSSALHRYFDRQILKLYTISDIIGCPSQASIRFLHNHYPELTHKEMEICPNCIGIVREHQTCEQDKQKMREKWSIPNDAVLFLYGGNFGKPQGVEFIMKALESFKDDKRVFFLLVGAGTEYCELEQWIKSNGCVNIIIFPHIPKDEYKHVISGADVGMVFLNECFTVPNIPSRTLDYMQASLPVLAAVDSATDFRRIIEEGGFGLGSLAGDVEAFRANVEKLMDKSLREKMGRAGRTYLEAHWTAEKACDIILKHFSIS